MSKRLNLIQNLFNDIKTILNHIEFKNSNEAKKYETNNSAELSELWMKAMVKDDNYITYSHWWDTYMFQQIFQNTRLIDIEKWKKNPFSLPQKYQESILKISRELFLSKYVEENNYYRKLIGLPNLNEKEFVYISKEAREKMKAPNKPIHELSFYWQNRLIVTDEYKKILKDNPDKEYLKYIGINKINLYTARKAKDFEIIRYSYDILNINPSLLNTFLKVYNDCREYVMVALYNEQFEDLYKGYREFMGLLILSYTIMQITNKNLENMKELNFFDDSTLYSIMTLYNMPTDIHMTKEVRRLLVKNIPKLIQRKATDDIYYDIIDILGYDEVKVSKLYLIKNEKVLNKGEVNNDYTGLDSNNHTDGIPYFAKIDLKDKDPYKTIMSGNYKKYPYKSITENDPMWLNTNDVKEKIMKSEYSITDSKYIALDVEIHQNKYMVETVLFPRMILDNKQITDNIKISLSPYLSEEVSLYELMLAIICVNCKVSGMNGSITYHDGLYAIYGFNFDLNLDELTQYIDKCKYIDKNKINKFINGLYINSLEDIYRVFNNIVSLREWFEKKILYSINRREYNEYINIYRSFFSYDIIRNKFLDDFEKPLETIKKLNNISEEELQSLMNFYPHTEDHKSLTVKEYNKDSKIKYSFPFLSRDNIIDWYINIKINTQYGEEDRGNLYFYDILNSDNCLTITNPDNTRIFMDYIDDDIGWKINQQAVDKALEIINKLDINALNKAYFQISTVSKTGKLYDKNTLLPSKIRSGMYKTILKDKLYYDLNGFSELPKTYFDHLKRENQSLYNLIFKSSLSNEDQMHLISIIINKIETVMNIHLKYFEKFILGDLIFFKQLIDLINRFKSNLVDFSTVDYKYIFDDKIDSSGSNAIKLFDEMKIKFFISNKEQRGHDAILGLYDVEHKMNFKILIKERSEILKMVIGEGFLAETRETTMGSIRLVDECKWFKNGKEIDPDSQPSTWTSGEPGTGRWDDEMNYLMKIRRGNTNITKNKIDMDGWKDFIPSKP